MNVGVDPMDFANMVSEAKRVVQESDERIKGLEGLAQDVYSQACSRIQELLGVVESLQLSNQGFQNQIHQLNSEVANVRTRLELKITRNHELGSRGECSANMLDHKEGEISRLMGEIHQLKDGRLPAFGFGRISSSELVPSSTLSGYGDEFGCTKRRSTS